MDVGITGWVAFNVAILLLLAFDLGVAQRRPHEPTLREAAVWSVFWIILGLGFGGYIWWGYGAERFQEYLAGYLIEKSLSVDNIFVFYVIFSYFGVDPALRHRVLFWGILGALIMRGTMIALGVYLIAKFHWILYVFGVILIITGIRMLFHREEKLSVEELWIVRLARRFVPMTSSWRGSHFFVREGGRLLATPLFLVVLVVEATDVVFAIDSIPAIFAVTRDPFIVYTSNVFAILGLRALFFLLAGIIPLFYYLKIALSAILSFVGVKMLLADTAWKIPTHVSLWVIVCLLTVAIAASWLRARWLATKGARPSE
ncbi:MAG: TerC family protein [Candidatus Sumerlaeaceae bacterium]|nr:TerC family protein [Candidatus Sumerlaeaceae bacterium]